MGVEDPAREGVEQRPGQHGAESRHGHEVDVVRAEHLGHPPREGPPVEAAAVAAEGLPVDELGVDTGRGRDLQGPAGSVGEHERDRHVLGEHGVEDAPSTRHEHRHAHVGHATSGAGAPRRAQSRDLTISTMRSPASVGLSATVAPASASAAILAWAVPWDPEMMAPACPIFRPGGAVTPAM